MLQVTVQVPDIPVPPNPPDPFFVPPPWVTLPPQVVLLISIAFIAGVTIVLWPLMRAFARRIEGRGVNPALQGEIEQLRARVRRRGGLAAPGGGVGGTSRFRRTSARPEA